MIPQISDIMDAEVFHHECNDLHEYLKKRKLTAHQALYICSFTVTNITSQVFSENEIGAFFDKNKEISLKIKNKEVSNEIYFN